jgi:hypothetical protein
MDSSDDPGCERSHKEVSGRQPFQKTNGQASFEAPLVIGLDDRFLHCLPEQKCNVDAEPLPLSKEMKANLVTTTSERRQRTTVPS